MCTHVHVQMHTRMNMNTCICISHTHTKRPTHTDGHKHVHTHTQTFSGNLVIKGTLAHPAEMASVWHNLTPLIHRGLRPDVLLSPGKPLCLPSRIWSPETGQQEPPWPHWLRVLSLAPQMPLLFTLSRAALAFARISGFAQILLRGHQ